MHKLRSDSTFCQLTTEQIETLKGWLFEERLGYKEVVKKLKDEFGLETSLSGVTRFYRRLAVERERENVVELLSTSQEVAGALRNGTLQTGILALGNARALGLLVDAPQSVREFTALLRTLTSAQGMEMKRVAYQREEDRIQKAREDRAREEQLNREKMEQWKREEEFLAKLREEKRQAKLAAKKKAEEEAVAMAAEKAQNAESEKRVIINVASPGEKFSDGILEATSPRPSPPEAERVTDGAGDAPVDNSPGVLVSDAKTADALTAEQEEQAVAVAEEATILDLDEYARLTGRDALPRHLIRPNFA